MNAKRIGMSAALAAVTLAAASPLAHAMGTEGHGGVAIVCPPGNKYKTMLLDAYEASREHSLTITPSDAPPEQQYQKIVDRLSPLPHLQSEFIYHYQLAKSKMHFISEDEELTMTKDFDTHVIPRGCQLGQLANWGENDVLDIDPVIYRTLDNSGRNALLVHEGIYHFFRQEDRSANSDQARVLVAYLLADQFDLEQVKAHRPQYAVNDGFTPAPNDPWRIKLFRGFSDISEFLSDLSGMHLGMDWNYRQVRLDPNSNESDVEIVVTASDGLDMSQADLIATVGGGPLNGLKIFVGADSIQKKFIGQSASIHLSIPESLLKADEKSVTAASGQTGVRFGINLDRTAKGKVRFEVRRNGVTSPESIFELDIESQAAHAFPPEGSDNFFMPVVYYFD